MNDHTKITLPVSVETNITPSPAPSVAPVCAVGLDDLETPSTQPPTGFQLRQDGIYQFRADETGAPEWVKICSPIKVIGLCRRPGGLAWGRFVRVEDPDGKWHEMILDERGITRNFSASLDRLLDHGLCIGSADKALQSVRELLQIWKPKTRFTRVSRLGWVDATHAAFSLGNGTVLGSGNVVFDGVSPDIAATMHARGTLDEWRSSVSELCVGNPLMILAVSCAFTGPLLGLMDMTSGGFHLRGASSRGKSTLLRAAASVWGAPDFMQSWRGTDNGFEAVSAACNDCLLVLDELSQGDPRKAGEIVYMLGNEQGRRRMGAGLQSATHLRWRVPILSSGEISLAEHMSIGGRRAREGQNVRLIDIAADMRRFGAFDALHGVASGRDFADQVQRATRASYGTAGPEFVRQLILSPKAKEVIGTIMEKFSAKLAAECNIPSDGRVQRVMRRFVITAVAGEIATHFGITGWKPGNALAAVKELFGEWLKGADIPSQGDIDQVTKMLASYVSANRDRFFDLKTSKGVESDGWQDDKLIYFRPECWASILTDENHSDAARLLRSAGLLQTSEEGSLQFKMPRAITGRPRVYAVRRDALPSSTPECLPAVDVSSGPED